MQTVRKNLGAQALMVAVVLIGLYFGYSFAREVVQAERLSRQVDSATVINKQLTAENDKLERDLQYYQSDAYVELRALTDLGLHHPDELVIFTQLPPETPTPAATVTSAIPTPALTPLADANVASVAPAPDATPATVDSGDRNWDRWFSLLTSMWR